MIERDGLGRFVGIGRGYGGDLANRIALQECLEHCLNASTVQASDKPRHERPGVVTAEELSWTRQVIDGRPEWAITVLNRHGFKAAS